MAKVQAFRKEVLSRQHIQRVTSRAFRERSGLDRDLSDRAMVSFSCLQNQADGLWHK